jgi:hypothetical protein
VLPRAFHAAHDTEASEHSPIRRAAGSAVG